MAGKEQGPHPERKHLDTIPMKSVLKSAFRAHRTALAGSTTTIEHIGVHPHWRTPLPVDRIASYVFDPPQDEGLLMSSDQEDYVSHKLELFKADDKEVAIVISQNGAVRSIPETTLETALDSDKNRQQIESEFADRELGIDVMGEGEVSSLLLSIVEDPELSSLIADEELPFLDPDSNSQLQSTTRELFKRVIGQLAQTDSEYRSTIQMGEDIVHITTYIPFGCEPTDDGEIPDSVANSAGVDLTVESPSPEDDRYKIIRNWFYYVGRSRYSSETTLTNKYPPDPVFGDEVLDELERKKWEVARDREVARKEDVIQLVDEYGLPPMSPHEWQEGMQVLNRLNDGKFLEGLGEVVHGTEHEAFDNLNPEARERLANDEPSEPRTPEELEVEDLIDRSSLGTPEAKILRDLADPEVIEELLRILGINQRTEDRLEDSPEPPHPSEAE